MGNRSQISEGDSKSVDKRWQTSGEVMGVCCIRRPYAISTELSRSTTGSDDGTGLGKCQVFLVELRLSVNVCLFCKFREEKCLLVGCLSCDIDIYNVFTSAVKRLKYLITINRICHS